MMDKFDVNAALPHSPMELEVYLEQRQEFVKQEWD